jgi:hypothetical protein
MNFGNFREVNNFYFTFDMDEESSNLFNLSIIYKNNVILLLRINY